MSANKHSEPLLTVTLKLTPSEASCLLHALERAIDKAAPFAKGRLESVRNKANQALYSEVSP